MKGLFPVKRLTEQFIKVIFQEQERKVVKKHTWVLEVFNFFIPHAFLYSLCLEWVSGLITKGDARIHSKCILQVGAQVARLNAIFNRCRKLTKDAY